MMALLAFLLMLTGWHRGGQMHIHLVGSSIPYQGVKPIALTLDPDGTVMGSHNVLLSDEDLAHLIRDEWRPRHNAPYGIRFSLSDESCTSLLVLWHKLGVLEEAASNGEGEVDVWVQLHFLDKLSE